MEKKNTDGLRKEMMDSPDLTQFLSSNQEQFVSNSVADLLIRLFEQKHISKAALAKQAGMSEIYLHQIFAGRLPATGCSACATDWTQAWRKRRSCCGSAGWRSSIRSGNGTPSSITGCFTGSLCSRSTTGCLTKTKKPCSDRMHTPGFLTLQIIT